MTDVSTMTQAMTQRFRDFVYFPMTDWRDFFRPTFYFGCNVSDAPTERAVLDDVGSYGRQINQVMDALEVLIRLAGPEAVATLPVEDQERLWRLRELHRRASDASKRAESA